MPWAACSGRRGKYYPGRYGYWISRTCNPVQEDEGRIECIFGLDTGMGWGTNEHPSPVLTWLVNRTINLYMHVPLLQSLLPIGSAFRSLFLIRPIWYEIPTVAEARYTYRVRKNSVEIACRIYGKGRDLPTIFVLNEVGADAFSAAYGAGKVIAAPHGWEPYPHSDERWLYDPSRRLHFHIALEEVSEGMAAHLFWGREKARDLCWAGYGIRMEPQRPLSAAMCRYSVVFNRGYTS
jgi:hypothetical protein